MTRTRKGPFNDPDPKGPIMNLRQIAKYLGIHEMTTYRLLKQGKLPGFKIGGSWRVHKDVLDMFLDKESNG